MTDIVNKATRSRMMAGIRGTNTKPERVVRSWLHRQGLRFRINKPDLPGRPDIALTRYRTAIFVHGCFWHRHPGCRYASTPASNASFWQEKFQTNVDRDRKKAAALRRLGWRVVTIWECQVGNEGQLVRLANLIRSRPR